VDKNNIETINNQKNEFLIYTSSDGACKIQVKLIDETVWLTQAQMVELFHCSKTNVSEHISNIFNEGELDKNATVRDFRTVQNESGRSVNRNITHYNLDVIISVGYRVKSIRGTQFRQWATQRLKEYLIKGFSINKEYLKDPAGKDYFEELLKEIREIRASEKRFYLKIRDIYATSIDYDKKSSIANDFFATIQNKLLWAVSGKTAAEIINSRANSNEPNMGIMSWEGKSIKVSDITIAKNYLDKSEINQLEHLTIMYLDYAELQADARKPMTMLDWTRKLDELLKLSDKEILAHKGKISAELAKRKARTEFEKFSTKRKEIAMTEEEEEFAKHIEELKKTKDLNKEIEV
jgi:hypothetical protein